MTHGYSVEQTARLLSTVRWACGRLAEIFEVWANEAAASGADDAAVAVRLMELSRCLTAHRQALDVLQPDSVRMEPWREPSPADEALAAALDEVSQTPGSIQRLTVACRVVLPELAGTYQAISDTAAPHCDAALIATARSLHDDLQRAAERTMPPASGTDTADATGSAVEAARAALSGAGGLVPVSLLRPQSWP